MKTRNDAPLRGNFFRTHHWEDKIKQALLPTGFKPTIAYLRELRRITTATAIKNWWANMSASLKTESLKLGQSHFWQPWLWLETFLSRKTYFRIKFFPGKEGEAFLIMLFESWLRHFLETVKMQRDFHFDAEKQKIWLDSLSWEQSDG